MVRLSDWYDRHISIQILDHDRVFHATITWVHDLPPRTVWVSDVEYQSHISPELENISDVFISTPLPDYFRSATPRCILLNVVTGEWYYVRAIGERIPIVVKQV